MVEQERLDKDSVLSSGTPEMMGEGSSIISGSPQMTGFPQHHSSILSRTPEMPSNVFANTPETPADEDESDKQSTQVVPLGGGHHAANRVSIPGLDMAAVQKANNMAPVPALNYFAGSSDEKNIKETSPTNKEHMVDGAEKERSTPNSSAVFTEVSTNA